MDWEGFGKRIEWARNTLKLTRKAVAEGSGLPYSTYFQRELGMRTRKHEQFQQIADYLNEAWQVKYKGKLCPKYNGLEVKEINFYWIVSGSYQKHLDIDSATRQTVIEMERFFTQKELELKKQLDTICLPQNDSTD